MKKQRLKITKKNIQRLSDAEYEGFLHAAFGALPHHRTLAMMLLYTGCDISEAIAVTTGDLDLYADSVLLGNSGSRRSVPLPREAVTAIEAIHGLQHLQSHSSPSSARLWPVNRTTAFRWIKKIMNEAKIPESSANARALRHTCAFRWVEQGVPLQTLHIWLGNTSVKHTESYYGNPSQLPP